MGHWDEDTLEAVLGDSVTESYGRCLASVCDGDLAPLKQLFEDTRASVWARGAALDALVGLAVEGEASRDSVVQYLAAQGDVQASRLRKPGAACDSVDLIDWIVSAACDLVATELKERIQNWFDDNLIDTTVTNKRWVDFCMSGDFDGYPNTLFKGLTGFVRDVEDEMRGWAGFEDDLPPSDTVKRVTADASPARANYYTPPIEPVVRTSPKIGRNDPCPCGSGKKYKKCCGVG